MSEDKKEAIENIKESLKRHRFKLEELSRMNGPYHYDRSPDRDQYNFVHGMVCAYREILMCYGVRPADID